MRSGGGELPELGDDVRYTLGGGTVDGELVNLVFPVPRSIYPDYFASQDEWTHLFVDEFNAMPIEERRLRYYDLQNHPAPDHMEYVEASATLRVVRE